MKAKQKKIRVFDIIIDDKDKFFEFVKKNFLLIKDYLLLLNGHVDEEIEKFLKDEGLCFVVTNGCNIKKIDPKPQSQPKEQTVQNEPFSQPQVLIKEQIIYQENDAKTKVINKPVRSGEVIEHDGDVIVFSRVNSGAKIVSEGNVCIFDTIDGVVEANGDYMIINSVKKGYVVFNGDILDKELFEDGKTKKVLKTKDGFSIEDL